MPDESMIRAEHVYRMFKIMNKRLTRLEEKMLTREAIDEAMAKQRRRLYAGAATFTGLVGSAIVAYASIR